MSGSGCRPVCTATVAELDSAGLSALFQRFHTPSFSSLRITSVAALGLAQDVVCRYSLRLIPTRRKNRWLWARWKARTGNHLLAEVARVSSYDNPYCRRALQLTAQHPTTKTSSSRHSPSPYFDSRHRRLPRATFSVACLTPLLSPGKSDLRPRRPRASFRLSHLHSASYQLLYLNHAQLPHAAKLSALPCHVVKIRKL